MSEHINVIKWKDEDVICQVGREEVYLHDYKTLKNDTKLNDSIVNAYLAYLKTEELDKKLRENVVVFPSTFWLKLTEDKFGGSPEKRHQRVSRWTKNVDIFSKKCIVFPICKDDHWFVIIVLNASFTMSLQKEKLLNGEPFMLVFCSMGYASEDETIKTIREYLSIEWKVTQKTQVCSFNITEMPAIFPEVPRQTNGTDCGLYLLHYIEKFFNRFLKTVMDL
jgi:sentrin-specific protease 7